MDAIATPTLMDPDDLLLMPDGEHYELIDGLPVEKSMGAEASEVGVTLAFLLGAFVRQHKLGRMYDGQTGFQCFPGKPRRVRKPDAAFVAAERLPDGKSPKGDFKIAPDLAIEVVSPNDLYEEVEEKLADYHAAGVRLVWVVSPGARTVQVRRLDGSATVIREDGELSGEDVVPGFTGKVADLFT